MKEKILSICIPCFNVEKYIRETLESIENSYYLDLLDVIMVNDGSTDGTLYILNEFHDKYPHSFSIVDKENGGYGSVLNRGLDEAKGLFFCLMDGDDWYDTIELDKIIRFMIDTSSNYKYDLLITDNNRINVTTGENIKCKKSDLEPGKLYYLEKELPRIGYDQYLGITDIFIATHIFRDNRIIFHNYTHYVDMEYCTFYLPYVEKFVYIDASAYQYRVGNPESGSQMKAMMRLSENHFLVTKSLMDFYKNAHLEENKKKYVWHKVINMANLDAKIQINKYYITRNKEEILNYIVYMEQENMFSEKRLKKWRFLRGKSKFVFFCYYHMMMKRERMRK